MIDVRTHDGRVGLSALCDDPATSLIAVDFDGTLAPIVASPADARPAAGAADALAACSEVFGTVAVVTGRPAGVVVPLLGLDGATSAAHLVVVGHYGLERWQASTGIVAPEPHPGVSTARERLAATGFPPGVVVEDKGRSVAVHTRLASRPDEELARLRPQLAALASELGLEISPGRLVLELRPPGVDKGTALRSLVAEREARAALVCGDDVGDLPFLGVVDDLRRRGGAGVVVFVDSPEGPALLRDRADLVVDGPHAVVSLLRELCEAARG